MSFEDVLALLGQPVGVVAEAAVFGEPQVAEQDSTWSITDKRAGISGRAIGQPIVQTVQLYSAGYDGYQEYVGDLPGGLAFSSTRRDAREALGPPTSSGEADEVFGIAVPAADTWAHDDWVLLLSYADRGESVAFVTVQTRSYWDELG